MDAKSGLLPGKGLCVEGTGVNTSGRQGKRNEKKEQMQKLASGLDDHGKGASVCMDSWSTRTTELKRLVGIAQPHQS